MREFKDSHRSLVRVTYDGRVHKTFRGKDAEGRFANEVRILQHLEEVDCPNVPRLLEHDPAELKIVTTSVGQVVQDLRSSKLRELFANLEQDYGVRHDDPFPRNITYSGQLGCFCIIDFELAEIVTPAATRTLDREGAA